MPLRFIPAIHRITHQIGLSLGSTAGLDVSQGEAHILAHLAGSGTATIAELHQALAHKRSTLTSILDRLAERQWIVRQSSAADRRSFEIALTPAGKRHARKVLRYLETLEQEMERRLTPAERRQFAGLLEKVTGQRANSDSYPASERPGRASRPDR
jgi:DNA-binding MarR family transcriptional regulator